ncbi:FtsX-like permease family protein [Maribellus comscasis]|uniref:FtsX-like permease family protein n=1 Tax=Maribellus comscasis TaxID=2681766 RepID=A0A6I6JUB6_9BACT|nr:ABC transporter permease [Maribellus comscasis]QGY44660.1 FtsX-like permease family protein [Maribellus comscasis]
MLINKIKLLIRNSLKLKQSLLINLIGLSVGFAVIITIAFFVEEEKAFDQFHEQIENLYCVFTIEPATNNSIGWHESVPAIPGALRNEYPEITNAALVRNGTENMLVEYGNSKNYEDIQLAEPNLFHMFSFPLVLGEIPEKTNETHIIALSQKMATKYFGNEDPIGKPITINNKDKFTVVAVYKDMPKNSSINFDFWIPIELVEETEPGYLDTWYNLSFKAYALLQPGISYTEVNKKLYNRIQQSNPESKDKVQLYPYAKLHLEAWGHQKNVRTMSLIGIIVMLLVCLNFINLQTAEVFKRIKQFGIKKINGASNQHISFQLFAETFLQTFLALLLGIMISYAGKPYLLHLINKPNTGAPLLTGFTILVVLVCVFMLSALSGFVPSLTIRSITPTNSLKEKISEKVSVKKLRLIIMATQFSLAIIFIASLMITAKQVQYLQNKNLGFNKEQLLYIRLDGELYDKRDVLQQTLEQNSNVVSTSLATNSPVGIYWNGGGWEWDGKDANFDPQVTYIETDKNFSKTFGIKMAQGDFFDADRPGVVINNTFAQMIAPGENVLGKILILEDQGIKIPITGVIEDIHFKPLNRKIGALMFIPEMGFENMRYLFVKLSPVNMTQTLNYIEQTAKELNPDFPYWHHFLDDDFARLYTQERTLRSQMAFFSILAILISCMGLWGIMVFVVKQRVKEIGVRKVNGAKVSEILALLNKDFVKWVVVAFVIAIPVVYYAMNNWLENFAYKTSLSWWIFALAGLLALGIALLTVSWQSWRAATRNPVEALRYE